MGTGGYEDGGVGVIRQTKSEESVVTLFIGVTINQKRLCFRERLVELARVFATAAGDVGFARPLNSDFRCAWCASEIAASLDAFGDASGNACSLCEPHA